jgi:hypothetical protein
VIRLDTARFRPSLPSGEPLGEESADPHASLGAVKLRFDAFLDTVRVSRLILLNFQARSVRVVHQMQDLREPRGTIGT